MPEDQRPTQRGALEALKSAVTALMGAPVRGLGSKIVSIVFITALVASLGVTWFSAKTIQEFLREKTDERLPAILADVSGRLEHWYDQRELDLQTFASSSTLQENLSLVGEGRRGERANREIEQYLSYVLERFPQYTTLFITEGGAGAADWSLWVGPSMDLPEPVLQQLAKVTAPRIGAAFGYGGRTYQMASTPIVDASNRRLATLHAAIDLDVPQQEVQRDGLRPTGALLVISEAGRVLMQRTEHSRRTRYSRPLPLPGALPAVEVYEVPGRAPVVGSAMRFARFGWTVAVEEPADELFQPAVRIVREILVVNVGIALICCLLAMQIARSIVKPIQALSDAAHRVARGEPDVSFPEHGKNEIGVLGRTFNEMLARLQSNRVKLEDNRVEIEAANDKLVHQNEELQRVNEVFLQLSITDDLTKLHNHRFFQDHLPREMSRSKRTGEPLCLILIDIDDFKKLNDRYGHSVGDAVLKRTAVVMNDVVREMDLLARYGGEEFALLASQTDLDGAVALAEKIRLEVSSARFPVVTLEGSSELAITVSIGVAPFSGDDKALFNDADRALYRAKADGKDCVVVAGPPQAPETSSAEQRKSDS